MIYLFTFFIVSFYLFFTENNVTSSGIKQITIWFPAIVFFAFPLCFQYQVGTDYDTYYNYFYNDGHILHKERGEFLYYYLVEFVKHSGEPQLQFVIVGLVQSLLFFFMLYLLKKNGFKSWLIFVLFFLCTGIYNNSMNGLRQFIAIYIFLIGSILIFEKKYLKFLFSTIFSLLVHFSSLFSFTLLLLLKKIHFNFNNKYMYFYVFCLSLVLYSINYTEALYYILNYLDLRYVNYFDSDFSEGKDFSSVALKFYYLPLVLIFWFYYLKDNNKNELLSFFILIFSVTYFMFLQGLSFGLFLRIWQYFNFFLIFPLYYIFNRLDKFGKLFLLLYVFVFYMLKVLFFPVAEYDYFFYKLWF